MACCNLNYDSDSSESSVTTAIYDPIPLNDRTAAPAPSSSNSCEASASASGVIITVTSPTPPPARGRARSNSIRGSNPVLGPITPEEQRLANLARAINRQNESDSAALANSSSLTQYLTVPQEGRYFERSQQQSGLNRPGGYQGTWLTSRGHSNSENTLVNQPGLLAYPAPTHPPLPLRYRPAPALRYPTRPITIGHSSTSDQARTEIDSTRPTTSELQYPPPTYTNPRILSVDIPDFPTHPFEDQKRALTRIKITRNMNSQNYIETPQGASNPRQAPPSPSQGMAHTNGMNGGMSAGNGLVGYPTPAGHQSDLNYVMSMVEELSGILRINQQLTASVVDKMGKVREKAKNMNLSNDELIQVVADEMNQDSENLEKENSELRLALEKSEHNKKENWKLAVHGAEILADIAEKMHRFKEQHEADTLAWHKNYRQQLTEEREENLNLRNQINDMKAAACRANESLRQMRRFIADNDRWHELEVSNHHLRTEKRFWKRLALPLIPDDDSEWSDDDDLIDPEEKKREIAKREKERKDKEDGSFEDGDHAS